jgi:hypothetical protein
MTEQYEFFPPDVAATLPGLYSQEPDDESQERDPVAYVKFFTPDSSWTWYALEYDPEDRLFFGYVVGMEAELGYFALDELRAVRGPLGLKIERDLYFSPTPLSQIRLHQEAVQ